MGLGYTNLEQFPELRSEERDTGISSMYLSVFRFSYEAYGDYYHSKSGEGWVKVYETNNMYMFEDIRRGIQMYGAGKGDEIRQTRDRPSVGR